MSDKELRSKLIRLAHDKPELRREILPLLKGKGRVARAGEFYEIPSRDGQYMISVRWDQYLRTFTFSVEDVETGETMVAVGREEGDIPNISLLKKMVRHEGVVIPKDILKKLNEDKRSIIDRRRRR